MSTMRSNQRGRTSSVRWVLSWLGLFVLCGLMAPAGAQGWRPDKAIEVIAASGSGGSTDRIARTIQRILQDEKIVNVAVTVVNKPGGNQTLARTYLNQHAGDAHYVDVGNPTLLANNLMGLTSQHFKDFTPIALLFNEYTVFSVREDSPIKTGRDLLQRLAQQPESVGIGITTRGGANHMALALAAKADGTDVKRLKVVVFKSNSESMTALLGGHIELVASSVTPAIPHFQNGNSRIVAISAPRRMGGPLAQVPTWKEQGVAAVNSNWRAVVGPKGLQVAQVAFWEDAVKRIAKSGDWQKDLEKNFWEDHLLLGKEFLSFLESQQQVLREVLTDLGLVK